MQSQEDLRRIQEESQRQALPEQKRVFSVSEKIRRRAHNLPDPTKPPLGYDEHKAFERVFPYIRLPRLHPPNHGDTIIFNAPELPANQLILGDNLEVLRTLPSESIDLIYIDPPFATGADFSINMRVGDLEWTKEASVIEEKAYRDTSPILISETS